MSETHTTQPTPKKAPRQIGRMAQTRRDELAALKETHLRQTEKFREEQRRIERELAELDAQERRAKKQQDLANETRCQAILGKLVLRSISQAALNNFSFGPVNLEALREDEKDLMLTVLTRMASPDATGVQSIDQELISATQTTKKILQEDSNDS